MWHIVVFAAKMYKRFRHTLVIVNSSKRNFVQCARSTILPQKISKSYRKPFVLVSVLPVIASWFGKDDKEESSIVKSIKLAVLAMQRNELEKAERLLHVALRTAQQFSDAQAVSYVYSLMSDVALRRQQWSKAEQLLKTLAQRLAAGSTEDNAFIEVSLKLAGVYAAQGDRSRAGDGYGFCMDTQRHRVELCEASDAGCDDDTLVLWAMCLSRTARFLSDLQEARRLLEQALLVRQRLAGGETDAQSVVLLNDLATLDASCGDLAAAEQRLRRAVQLADSQQLVELAVYQVNLGRVQLQRGLLEEARHSCSSARLTAEVSGQKEAHTAAQRCLKQVEHTLAKPHSQTL